MIKEARGFGATINEAKENAIAQLGAGIDDDIQFEVITTPKKKILGLFGGCKAEVRVYFDKPESKRREKKSAKNNQSQNSSAKSEKKKSKNANSAKSNKPTTESPIENTAKETKQHIESTTAADDYKDAVDAALIPADSPTGRAIAYLNSVLAALGCTQTTIKAAIKENGAFIVLDGEDLGIIIGRRGETLDSLQYLTSLVANNGGKYFKISLNIGNYREKREQTLVALADRISRQVLKTGRSRSLEPMNPYERRIIHTAVQNIDGVVSSSIGEGDRRRVIITPENGDSRPPRRDNSNHRKGSNHKPSAAVTSEPSREPKKDSDVPLYGKIN